MQRGSLSEYLRRELGVDSRPGIVVSIATAGDLLQWNPHLHVLMTDGAFSADAASHALETWDADAVMKLFRERLLARLVQRHAISEELVKELLAWRHPGFSTHVGEAIPFEDKKAVEHVACSMVRGPLSLQKLVYLDGQRAVLYRGKMNPSLGRNFERRCSPSWARLIAKLFHADPLTCRNCGGKLKVVAYVSDGVSIKRILAALGLSPPEEKPPPIHEVVRVPLDEEPREIQVG